MKDEILKKINEVMSRSGNIYDFGINNPCYHPRVLLNDAYKVHILLYTYHIIGKWIPYDIIIEKEKLEIIKNNKPINESKKFYYREHFEIAEEIQRIKFGDK